MEIWPKPFIYTLSHLLIGFAGYYSNSILVLFILYQFIQLFFNTRFFLFSLKFEKGNSIEHTFLKLGEMFLGYLLAYLFEQFIKKNKASNKA